MKPEGHKYPINLLSVSKFGVELMARPSYCNITVKFHEAISQIFMANRIRFKGFVHYSCFIFIEEEK